MGMEANIIKTAKASFTGIVLNDTKRTLTYYNVAKIPPEWQAGFALMIGHWQAAYLAGDTVLPLCLFGDRGLIGLNRICAAWKSTAGRGRDQRTGLPARLALQRHLYRPPRNRADRSPQV